jgi:hypothetical protein
MSEKPGIAARLGTETSTDDYQHGGRAVNLQTWQPVHSVGQESQGNKSEATWFGSNCHGNDEPGRDDLQGEQGAEKPGGFSNVGSTSTGGGRSIWRRVIEPASAKGKGKCKADGKGVNKIKEKLKKVVKKASRPAEQKKVRWSRERLGFARQAVVGPSNLGKAVMGAPTLQQNKAKGVADLRLVGPQ